MRIEISEAPLDLAALQESVRDDTRGGVVTFCGDVRRETGDEITDCLFYEAHPTMAITQMRGLAATAADRWNARVAIAHRIGELQPGETAVICVAACAHRAEAFECCRYLIDRLKEEVPIWKKDRGVNGERWIGGAS